MSRRTFTAAFKTDAAKLVLEQGYSIKKAADSLGVDPAGVDPSLDQEVWPERRANAAGRRRFAGPTSTRKRTAS